MAASPQSLIDALESIEGRKYAVLDAAHFDDLQSQLKALSLPFMPLYLDERDDNALAAGPHLVPLSDRDAAKVIVTLCADKPAVVWWVWPDEGDDAQAAIVRHLRGINMAEIPVDRYDADPAPPGDDGGTAAALAAAKAEAEAHSHEHEGHDHGHDHPPFVPPVRYELVLFRHADPNVMAMLLPLLDAEQVSRLFGKANGLVLDAPDHGGLKTYPRPQNLPDMPNGWLQIRPEQYEGLGNEQKSKVARGVRNFLRKHAVTQTQHASNAELDAFVIKSMSESLSFGIKTEASHCRWAYLQLLTGGQLMTLQPLQEAMLRSSRTISPDDRVRLLMRQVIAQIKAAG